MTTSPIDDYIHEVDHHLKLRGRARQQALDDLRDAADRAHRGQLAGNQRVNLAIKAEFERLGVKFAFPTSIVQMQPGSTLFPAA